MKFLAIIATAAAVRLQAEKKIEGKVTVDKIWEACNTDNNEVLDAEEVVSCMKDNGVSKAD